jgi:hypothetical protein
MDLLRYYELFAETNLIPNFPSSVLCQCFTCNVEKAHVWPFPQNERNHPVLKMYLFVVYYVTTL